MAFLLLQGPLSSGEDRLSWRETLMKFGNSEEFKAAIAHDYLPNSTLRGFLLQHLRTTGLTYKSPDDIMREVKRLLSEDEDSPAAFNHLVFLNVLTQEMRAEFPRVPSIERAARAAAEAVEAIHVAPPAERLAQIVRTHVRNHAIERHIIEGKLETTIDNPNFPVRLLNVFLRGDLDDSLRRLMLGPYINLRSVFSPTYRQAQSAQTRLAHAGNRGLEIRRARRYANPRNFIRNGWAPEHDMLRIATGNMSERAYRVADPQPQDGRKPAIDRRVLLLTDVTSSMHNDNRWKLRNLLVASYIDELFTKAAQRDEKMTVYMITYHQSVSEMRSASNLKEALALFNFASSDETAVSSGAFHTKAMITGLKQILSSPDKPTHVNATVFTDGQENVDMSALKEYTDKLTGGPEGIRLGISAVSLVDGERTLGQLTNEMARVDQRFAQNKPVLQHFDSAAVEQWTNQEWRMDLTPELEKPQWRANAHKIENLTQALRSIDYVEHKVPSESEEKAPPGNNSDGEGSNEQADAPKPDEDNRNDDALKNDTEEENEVPDQGDQKTEAPKEESLNNQSPQKNWEKGQEEDRVLYQLQQIRGPLPPMLMTARRSNLPDTIQYGVEAAVAARELYPVKLSAVGRIDLIVKSNVETVITGGLALIAKPEGYVLSGIEITGSKGEQIKAAEVFEIARNGLYIASFKKSKYKKGKFTYTARYTLDQRMRRRSPLFDNLDKDALAKVAHKVADDLLLRTAYTIARLSRKRKGVSIEDVNTYLMKDAVYTYEPESEKPPATEGLFAKYQKFLRDGRLYYQCNAANPLLRDVIRTYAEERNLPYLRAENVSGFVVTGLQVTGATGHKVTIVSDERIPFTSMKLDSTPREMDGQNRFAKIWDRVVFGARMASQKVSSRIDDYFRPDNCESMMFVSKKKP